jgi:hypothetical protein
LHPIEKLGDCRIARWKSPCDSAACFAALLGGPERGRWIIAPRDPKGRVSRRYLSGTLVLETTFETPEGAVAVVDFMPRDDAANLVRIVRGWRPMAAS